MGMLWEAALAAGCALGLALAGWWLLGRLRPWLVYVWMLCPLISLALPLPEVFGLWNGSFFTQYPLTLGTLDPAFSMPAAVLLVQGMLLSAGIVLLGFVPKKRCPDIPSA